MTAFEEASVPTLWLQGRVGCNPRMTFDGKVRNLGPCVLKFDSTLPEDHALVIQVGPKRRCFCSHESDFALQAHVECSAFELERVVRSVLLRRQSSGIEVRRGLAVGL